MIYFPAKEAPIWGARASRVLANASSRSRTFRGAFLAEQAVHKERLFWRDAESPSRTGVSTRDACATQTTPQR